MLNKIIGVSTVRDELEAVIEKSYAFYLRNSLHD
jgi:hypothetical protein